MLALRLRREGKKKKPTYRLIVSEKSKDTRGDYLENLGFYNPQAKPKVIKLNAERIKYWLGVGAQPSATVHNLLVSQGIISGLKRKVVKMHRVKEEVKKEAKATSEAKQ